MSARLAGRDGPRQEAFPGRGRPAAQAGVAGDGGVGQPSSAL
ncbi:hypothetical protein BEI_3074 [Halomonas beimenensis]|uniref:Uncharacterized protein n=1 Tax=Halomonas beimenensis TaxID=475662 RepID=A0A291PB31_9GAMM|nr:hypothetical protein BEI_3074 [Halomonas beimenensis]